MKNLKVFETKLEYNSYMADDPILPNVSYCLDEEIVEYNPYIRDYSKEYLTFEAVEDCVFTFTMKSKLLTSHVPYIAYSIDNGETWVTTNNIDNLEVVVTTPTVNAGNSILWKSNAVLFSANTDSYPGDNFGNGYFSSNGEYFVTGNIMSLLYGDNFKGLTTLPTPLTSGSYGSGTFCLLFSYNADLTDASNLILPATTLTTSCYSNMFLSCTNLLAGPELPAITLADRCYQNMFSTCSNLESTPTLPATTLASYCYMNMFSSCTNLTKVSKLPATTLATYCYSSMFSYCSSLTTAPELPATTLATNCYSGMFTLCSSLNYVKMMSLTLIGTNYTDTWLSDVSSTGTFVKNSNATYSLIIGSHIPFNWTVETANS